MDEVVTTDVPPAIDAAPVELPPEEEAAMRFSKMIPFVSKLADAMPSKGGLVRVIHAMAEFPLGAAKPRFLNDAERQLFSILQEVNGYKSTVITNIMQKNAELEKAKQQAVNDGGSKENS